MRAVTDAIGADRTGIRLSPWSKFQGMKMERTHDIKETFSYLVTELRQRHPDLAYVHGIESRVAGNETVDVSYDEQLDFIVRPCLPFLSLSLGRLDRELVRPDLTLSSRRPRSTTSGHLARSSRPAASRPRRPSTLPKSTRTRRSSLAGSSSRRPTLCAASRTASSSTSPTARRSTSRARTRLGVTPTTRSPTSRSALAVAVDAHLVNRRTCIARATLPIRERESESS